jgi:choloylglycine hydrolase
MTSLRISLAAVLTVVFATGAGFDAEACTAITLRAADGSVVYGRTMEWGAFDLFSRVMVVPRGQEFRSLMPDGEPGLVWTARHGFVGFDGLKRPIALDGTNDAGLTVGALYHPGFAEYPAFDPATRDASIDPVDVANYILSTFGSVAELRESFTDVRVVAVVEKALGFPAPLHFIVVDPTGAAVVIEFLDSKVQITDAPLGVLTNAPSYDWHMTNLRNFVNLSPVALPGGAVADLDFRPLGAGSGMIGLPGDFTPPSRFVRAVAFSATARPTEDGEETIYEAFRILDNFNVPLGAAEGSGLVDAEVGMRSATLWTSAVDTRNLVLYYHTQHNRRVRMVDLRKIDFGGLPGITYIPLDRVKAQDIEELTLP